MQSVYLVFGLVERGGDGRGLLRRPQAHRLTHPDVATLTFEKYADMRKSANAASPKVKRCMVIDTCNRSYQNRETASGLFDEQVDEEGCLRDDGIVRVSVQLRDIDMQRRVRIENEGLAVHIFEIFQQQFLHQ